MAQATAGPDPLLGGPASPERPRACLDRPVGPTRPDGGSPATPSGRASPGGCPRTARRTGPGPPGVPGSEVGRRRRPPRWCRSKVPATHHGQQDDRGHHRPSAIERPASPRASAKWRRAGEPARPSPRRMTHRAARPRRTISPKSECRDHGRDRIAGAPESVGPDGVPTYRLARSTSVGDRDRQAAPTRSALERRARDVDDHEQPRRDATRLGPRQRLPGPAAAVRRTSPPQSRRREAHHPSARARTTARAKQASPTSSVGRSKPSPRSRGRWHVGDADRRGSTTIGAQHDHPHRGPGTRPGEEPRRGPFEHGHEGEGSVSHRGSRSRWRRRSSRGQLVEALRRSLSTLATPRRTRAKSPSRRPAWASSKCSFAYATRPSTSAGRSPGPTLEVRRQSGAGSGDVVGVGTRSRVSVSGSGVRPAPRPPPRAAGRARPASSAQTTSLGEATMMRWNSGTPIAGTAGRPAGGRSASRRPGRR